MVCPVGKRDSERKRSASSVQPDKAYVLAYKALESVKCPVRAIALGGKLRRDVAKLQRRLPAEAVANPTGLIDSAGHYP